MTNDIAVLDSGGTITEAQLAGLGWTLRAEGLCQGDVCIPVPDRDMLVGDEGIDLAQAGRLLDRPVVLDDESGLAAIGAPRSRRRAAVEELVAPDFTLPNLNGGVTALSDHRNKKRLLVAFSSW